MHHRRSVFVTFDCRVMGRFPLEGQACGITEARSKLDNLIGGADAQSLEHPVGQLSPT
jgi:hypothetical protein